MTQAEIDAAFKVEESDVEAYIALAAGFFSSSIVASLRSPAGKAAMVKAVTDGLKAAHAAHVHAKAATAGKATI